MFSRVRGSPPKRTQDRTWTKDNETQKHPVRALLLLLLLLLIRRIRNYLIINKKIYQWTPHGRRRRGRPQLSWTNQVTDFMKSRGMEEDMAENRHLWRLGVDGRLLAV